MATGHASLDSDQFSGVVDALVSAVMTAVGSKAVRSILRGLVAEKWEAMSSEMSAENKKLRESLQNAALSLKSSSEHITRVEAELHELRKQLQAQEAAPGGRAGGAHGSTGGAEAAGTAPKDSTHSTASDRDRRDQSRRKSRSPVPRSRRSRSPAVRPDSSSPLTSWHICTST